MNEYLVVERTHRVGDGVQKLYKFPNGYGASVVRFKIGHGVGSYGAENGLWELAVIKWGVEKDGFELTYDTPIADDVLGYLSDEAVDETLKKIAALPPKENEK